MPNILIQERAVTERSMEQKGRVDLIFQHSNPRESSNWKSCQGADSKSIKANILIQERAVTESATSLSMGTIDLSPTF